MFYCHWRFSAFHWQLAVPDTELKVKHTAEGSTALVEKNMKLVKNESVQVNLSLRSHKTKH